MTEADKLRAILKDSGIATVRGMPLETIADAELEKIAQTLQAVNGESIWKFPPWTVDDKSCCMEAAVGIRDYILDVLEGIEGEGLVSRIDPLQLALIIKKNMDARPLEQHKHQS